MKTLRYILITLSASLLFGCGSSDSMQTANSLAGTSWQLLTMNAANPIGDNPVTLSFDESAVSGNAGCNQYGGSYSTDGNSIALGKGEDGSTGNLFATKKACGMPAGIMQQEQQYLQQLGSSSQYTLEKGTLTLTAKDGTLVYQQVQ